MKKIIYIITLLTIIQYSCSDELNLAPISDASVDNFYQTETDIEQAVVAAYDALQGLGQYGQNFMFFMEVRSDNATTESPTNSGGVFGEFDLFSLTPGNSVVSTSWNECYAGIQRCNIVLSRIDAVDMDQGLKNTRIGEVKFLRALTYFNMVRIWGDVPLVLEETTDPFESFEIGRTAASQVYDRIVTDLTDAASALPSTTTEAGRATSNAANALLGKVYLTLGQWSQAETALRSVSGNLLTNYADVFGVSNENNDESIFEVQFNAGGGEGSPYPNLVAPVGTSAELLGGIGEQKGENLPTNWLYDSFETGDVRRDVSIGELGLIRYSPKLIAVPLANRDSDVNVIVLRYADVVLMLAEALNEQSYVADGEAFDLMNQIRNRAGLADLTSADLADQTAFRTQVAEERRHEFVSENHRWFDLLRTGQAMSVMNASTSAFSVASHQLLYPIPLSAIDAMNNPSIFAQNDGY